MVQLIRLEQDRGEKMKTKSGEIDPADHYRSVRIEAAPSGNASTAAKCLQEAQEANTSGTSMSRRSATFPIHICHLILRRSGVSGLSGMRVACTGQISMQGSMTVSAGSQDQQWRRR